MTYQDLCLCVVKDSSAYYYFLIWNAQIYSKQFSTAELASFIHFPPQPMDRFVSYLIMS